MKMYVLVHQSTVGDFIASIMAENFKEAKEIFRITFNEKYYCNVPANQWRVQKSFPDSEKCNIVYAE